MSFARLTGSHDVTVVLDVAVVVVSEVSVTVLDVSVSDSEVWVDVSVVVVSDPVVMELVSDVVVQRHGCVTLKAQIPHVESHRWAPGQVGQKLIAQLSFMSSQVVKQSSNL